MTKKKIAVIGAGKLAATMAAIAEVLDPVVVKQLSDQVDKPLRMIKNEPKPQVCYREGCDKLRVKNKLYCSSECCKLDRIERKSN